MIFYGFKQKNAMAATNFQNLPDRIAAIFNGRSILVTGGSGFLGKLLVERLLRRCDGVKTIYLLIRNKKGKTPHERISEIFSNAVSIPSAAQIRRFMAFLD